MESRVTAVIFDLDGTLIDSAPDIRGAANAVLADRGAAPLSLEETLSFVGRGARIFVDRMFAARDLPAADVDSALPEFLRRYQSAVSLTTLYPGVRTALNALTAAGHLLALCTNKNTGDRKSVV